MNSALIIPYCADTEVGMIAATVIPNNTKTPVKLIRFLLFFLLLNRTICRGLWHGRFNSLEVSISVDDTSIWFVGGWNGTRKKDGYRDSPDSTVFGEILNRVNWKPRQSGTILYYTVLIFKEKNRVKLRIMVIETGGRP